MPHRAPEDSEQLGLPGLREDKVASPLAAPASGTRLIAPWWHTLAIVGILAFLALSGYLRAHSSPAPADYMLRSISAMISQALLTGAMIAGIYQRRAFFQSTLLNRPQPWTQDLARGVMVYIIGVGIIVLVGVVSRLSHVITPDRSLLVAILPHSWVQVIPWIGISACAGVGEELVFRGYLLQQARGLLGSAGGAVAATALLFGVMHSYEGWVAVVSLAALAAVYGAVTLRTGNLRAAMIAHTLQDFLTALFFVARHHRI